MAAQAAGVTANLAGKPRNAALLKDFEILGYFRQKDFEILEYFG